MKGQLTGCSHKVENNHLLIDIDLNGYLGDSSTGLSEMIATSSGRAEFPHKVTINGKSRTDIACVNLNVYRVIDEAMLDITTIKNKKGKEITVGQRKYPRGAEPTPAKHNTAEQTGEMSEEQVNAMLDTLVNSKAGKAKLASLISRVGKK